MKSVSVIIPTYNRAQYIGEAIESVLRQDIKDCKLEILVIDDGSTDNTREIVSRCGDKVKYIRQANAGAGKARNLGIEAAQGEWISFLDSDDRWLPYKLALQFKILECFPDIKVIHSNFYTFQDDRIIIEKGLDFWVESLLGSDIDWSQAYSRKYDSSELHISLNGLNFKIYAGNIFSSMLYASYGACWTMLVSREVLVDSVRFAEDFPTWEDYWFFCRLAEYNEILFMDIPTAENRGHSGPRLTLRPDFIDPLKCFLLICKNIYFSSRSPYRPSDERIITQYKGILHALMREYLKKGQLLNAKQTRRELDLLGGMEIGLDQKFYYFSSFLPFNVVSRLVRMKRLIEHLNLK